jgi:hypothetical protein
MRMPKTPIVVQDVPFLSAKNPVTFVQVDNANGMKFPNDGKTVLLVKNGGAAPLVVGVTSVADQWGRTGDLSVSVGVGNEALIGPLEPSVFNAKSGDDQGNTCLTFDGTHAAMLIAALRLRV